MANVDLANQLLHEASNYYNRITNFLYKSDKTYRMKNAANKGFSYSASSFDKLYSDFMSSVKSEIDAKEGAFRSFCQKQCTDCKSEIEKANNEYEKFAHFADEFKSRFEKAAKIIGAERWKDAISEYKAIERDLTKIVKVDFNTATKKAVAKIRQTVLYCYANYVRNTAEKSDITATLSEYKEYITFYYNDFKLSVTDEIVKGNLETYAWGMLVNAKLICNAAINKNDYDSAFEVAHKALGEKGFIDDKKEYDALINEVRDIWVTTYNTLSKKACADFDLPQVYRFIDAGKTFDERERLEVEFLRNSAWGDYSHSLSMPITRTFDFALQEFEKFDYKLVKEQSKFLKKAISTERVIKFYLVIKKDIDYCNIAWVKLWLKNGRRADKLDYSDIFDFDADTEEAVENALFTVLAEEDFKPKKDFMQDLENEYLKRVNLKEINVPKFAKFASLHISLKKSLFGDDSKEIRKSKYVYAKDIKNKDVFNYICLAIFRTPSALKQLGIPDADSEKSYQNLYTYVYTYFFGKQPSKAVKFKKSKSNKTAFDVTTSSVVSDERNKKVVAIAISVGVACVLAVTAICLALLL